MDDAPSRLLVTIGLAAVLLTNATSCAGNCSAYGCPSNPPLGVTVHGVSPAPDATHTYVLTVSDGSSVETTCTSSADGTFLCAGASSAAASFTDGEVQASVDQRPPAVDVLLTLDGVQVASGHFTPTYETVQGLCGTACLAGTVSLNGP